MELSLQMCKTEMSCLNPLLCHKEKGYNTFRRKEYILKDLEESLNLNPNNNKQNTMEENMIGN